MRKLRKVGPKGTVVIDARIRRELGIGPGWSMLQRAVNGQVVIDFLPPVDPGSLFGSMPLKGLETAEAQDAAMEQACRQGAYEDDLASIYSRDPETGKPYGPANPVPEPPPKER